MVKSILRQLGEILDKPVDIVSANLVGFTVIIIYLMKNYQNEFDDECTGTNDDDGCITKIK